MRKFPEFEETDQIWCPKYHFEENYLPTKPTLFISHVKHAFFDTVNNLSPRSSTFQNTKKDGLVSIKTQQRTQASELRAILRKFNEFEENTGKLWLNFVFEENYSPTKNMLLTFSTERCFYDAVNNFDSCSINFEITNGWRSVTTENFGEALLVLLNSSKSSGF